MHPILFQFPDWFPLLGGKAIHTYGALYALGFYLGMIWVKFEAKRLGINPEKVLDLFFYIIIASILGARITYVLISVPYWWQDPLVFLRFWEGGLVFYGGFIGAVLMSLYFCKKHHLSFLTIADIYSPGIALGHAIGRLGCFAAGCCYGKEISVNHWLAVTFPDLPESVAPHLHAVYPTQLMEAFGIFLIFIFLFLYRRKKHFEGEIFLIYLTLYPILRSVIEIYRGDSIRGFIIEGVLSTSQFISIIWVVIALSLWVSLIIQHKKRRSS